MIRIDGSLLPIDGSEVLTPEESKVIVDRLIGPDDLDRFNEDRQLDFSFPWGDQARFRANAYYQRNSPCLLYTSPSPRDRTRSRMPSSA